jgi:hypothetical protein
MPNFRLVNPVIVGSAKTSFSSPSPTDAAKMAWENLSEHMVNNNPKFAFTLQNLSDGNLFHYVVSEKIVGSNVDYSIKSIDLNLTKSQQENLVKHANKVMKQKGGEHHEEKKEHKKSKKSSDSSDDSSSSSSSSSVYEKVKMYKNNNSLISPITYWWYHPYYYSIDTYVDSVYIPVFHAPVSPYIEISLSSAFLG